MDDTTFDALTAAQTLRDAGFEDRQAEAVAETVRNGREGLATQADRDTLATKADIAEVKGKVADLEGKVADLEGKIADLKGEVVALRAERKTDIATLRADAAEREARLIRWVVGSMIAFAGVVVAADKFL